MPPETCLEPKPDEGGRAHRPARISGLMMLLCVSSMVMFLICSASLRRFCAESVRLIGKFGG